MVKYRYVWSEYTNVISVNGQPAVRVEHGETVMSEMPVSYMLSNMFVRVDGEAKALIETYKTKKCNIESRKKGSKDNAKIEIEELEAKIEEIKKRADEYSKYCDAEMEATQKDFEEKASLIEDKWEKKIIEDFIGDNKDNSEKDKAQAPKKEEKAQAPKKKK